MANLIVHEHNFLLIKFLFSFFLTPFINFNPLQIPVQANFTTKNKFFWVLLFALFIQEIRTGPVLDLITKPWLLETLERRFELLVALDRVFEVLVLGSFLTSLHVPVNQNLVILDFFIWIFRRFHRRGVSFGTKNKLRASVNLHFLFS